METVIRRIAFVRWVTIAILLFATSAVAADSGNGVKLNQIASAFAMELIKQGDVIADGKGGWTEHRPSAHKENEFIRIHGFAEYAKWHLGIDRRFTENSKRRYKFPYGDFRNVHRCGLLAVRARAAEHKYNDIEDAAAQLTKMIRSNSGVNAVLPKRKVVFLRLRRSPFGWRDRELPGSDKRWYVALIHCQPHAAPSKEIGTARNWAFDDQR